MESAVSALGNMLMTSVGVEEPSPTVPAPAPADTTGDATAHGDVDNIANTTKTSQENSPDPVSHANSASASASASATASPSPDLPPRIVSDIEPAASLPEAAPAAAPPISTSVASPAASASPSIHGLGARAGLRSTSNTPHHSPALASPPVPLRASPAASHPPPAPAPATAATTRASDYQNSPVWRAESSPRIHRKLPIAPAPTPAPAAGSSAPLPPVGFPSPGRDRIHEDPKFLDDKTRITYGIQQAIPEAVRRSVRDNWEKCLLGSEFHQAFVVSLIPSLPHPSALSCPASSHVLPASFALALSAWYRSILFSIASPCHRRTHELTLPIPICSSTPVYTMPPRRPSSAVCVTLEEP